MQQASGIDVGEVISHSITSLSRNLVPSLIVVVLGTLPSSIFGVVGWASGGVSESWVAFPLAAIGLLIDVFCSILASGAISYGIVQSLEGRAFTVREALSTAYEHRWALLGVSAAFAFGTMLVAIPLVFPAFMLACAWYVAGTVCLVERAGIRESLSRSSTLTRGHRWRICAVHVVVLIVLLVIGSAIAFLFHGNDGVAKAAIEYALQLIFVCYGSTIAGELFVRLRDLRRASEPPSALEGFV